MPKLEEIKAKLQAMSAAEQDQLYQNFCVEVLSATDTHDRAATDLKRKRLAALGRMFGFTNEHKSALMNQASARRQDILTLIETIVPA